jgi:hypothetical protein
LSKADGDSALAGSKNVERRSLTPGQKAMAVTRNRGPVSGGCNECEYADRHQIWPV